jgi:hypothetical protein
MYFWRAEKDRKTTYAIRGYSGLSAGNLRMVYIMVSNVLSNCLRTIDYYYSYSNKQNNAINLETIKTN